MPRLTREEHILRRDKGRKSVYAMLDPDGSPRYVGCSVNPRKRLYDHVAEVKRGEGSHEKREWLLGILRRGSRPGLLILDDTGGPRRERFWVHVFERDGHRLINGRNTIKAFRLGDGEWPSGSGRDEEFATYLDRVGDREDRHA